MKNTTLLGSKPWLPNNYLIALALSILFYLPYILHTFYNGETLARENLTFSLNPLPDMVYMLKTQYNPLNGFFMWNFIPYKIGIPGQILVLFGVIFFSIALYGFVNLFAGSLNKVYKLVIYLLALANPYIFTEIGWWGQFMGQGLTSCLYLISFILIDKYKSKPNSLKKIALAYGVPIFSVVFGLNFFMPSFFHFVVLAFLYVLKNHLEKPFKTVKEFFMFSLPLFIVMVLSAIIYTIEIKSLLTLVNGSINDSRVKDYDTLSSFNELIERLINIWKKHPKFYNLMALANATILFIVKRNKLNIIFIVLTPVVMLVSYGLYIMLNLYSTQIAPFSNYYLFVFLLAFVLVYLKSSKLKTIIKLSSFILIVFFYFSSYFYAMWGLKHEKVIKTELAKLEKVAYSQFEKKLPIFIVGKIKDWDKQLIKRPLLINILFTRYGYGLRIALSYSFNGDWYGFKNIKGSVRNVFGTKTNKLKIKEQIDVLRSQGKIYPKDGSMFLYNGTIYVVGDN